MIVAVVSPQGRVSGVSVVASSLALGLGGTNKKVILTHTHKYTDTYYTYFAIDTGEDNTSNPIQIAKLLQDGAIQHTDILDYCKVIGDGVYLFTNRLEVGSEGVMQTFISACAKDGGAQDYTIVDVEDVYSHEGQEVIKLADLVLWVYTPEIQTMKEVKIRSAKLPKVFRDKPIMYVCNKYNKMFYTSKDICKILGIKKTMIMHFNSNVIDATNTGRMLKLYKLFKTKGNRSTVIELDRDVQRLVLGVSKVKLKVKNRGV